MSRLDTPDDPKDLWLVGISEHRMLMQGDVIVTDDGPVCLVVHPCSMRRGSVLHDTQTVAPVRQSDAAWQGYYDWMPLPEVRLPGFLPYAACIREVSSLSTKSLQHGNRVAAMDDIGIHLLQQRMVYHLTRMSIDLDDLAELSAPILAEAEIHEEWVNLLGVDAEPDFHLFLDAENRKLREWLQEGRTRPQAIKVIRQEIRRRLSAEF